jgi:glycine/D-amino acid oxidase-like deaminating enzyme
VTLHAILIEEDAMNPAMNAYDAIVIGAGVIGTSTAFHLARLGARKVLVLDRKTVGEGTTSQSSGILRTTIRSRKCHAGAVVMGYVQQFPGLCRG